jgi:hypothetical protein
VTSSGSHGSTTPNPQEESQFSVELHGHSDLYLSFHFPTDSEIANRIESGMYEFDVIGRKKTHDRDGTVSMAVTVPCQL